MSKDKVYIVAGGGAKPGGFTFRNMGPNKVIINPMEAFPVAWIDPTTLKKLMADDHMKYMEKEGKMAKIYDEEAIDVEAVDVTEDDKKEDVAVEGTDEKEEPVFSEEFIKENCTFEKADIKDMKREELDNIVNDLAAVAGVEAPKFARKDEVVDFLTSGNE